MIVDVVCEQLSLLGHRSQALQILSDHKGKRRDQFNFSSYYELAEVFLWNRQPEILLRLLDAGLLVEPWMLDEIACHQELRVVERALAASDGWDALASPGSGSGRFYDYCDWVVENGKRCQLSRACCLVQLADDGRYDLIKCLAGMGAATLIDVLQDRFGYSPLILAAQQEDLAGVECLLALGASPNARDERCADFTPLSVAVGSKNIEMTELLLAAGADPKAVLPWGQTVFDYLHYMIEHSETEADAEVCRKLHSLLVR